MRKFTKARYIASQTEYRFAVDPIPFYWNSCEAPVLGIGCPFEGCSFDLVEEEAEIFDGIRIFSAPGHSSGHVTVQVQTEGGVYVLVGDLVLLKENFQPNKDKGWPFTPPRAGCSCSPPCLRNRAAKRQSRLSMGSQGGGDGC